MKLDLRKCANCNTVAWLALQITNVEVPGEQPSLLQTIPQVILTAEFALSG